jgi:cardiolipin synthase A/B
VSNYMHIPTPEYGAGNKATLIRGGSGYFDLLIRLIDNAAESIHLQTYIYDDDETGRRVAAALQAAARRNVQVYVLADGYASQVMSQPFINELRLHGVQFRFFEPLLKSRYFYFGRRMHHKIFVADAQYALVGGINISNRYNDTPGKPAWLDFALYTEGAAARALCILCWKTWNGFPKKMGLTPCEEKIPAPEAEESNAAQVSIKRNDWVRRKNEISATYVNMLTTAKHDITICCSYFLPGRIIRRLLSLAAARGVNIKVITAGHSDIMLAKHAERYLYDWLLRHHIELYEYQPSVLHAKVAVCDGQWMTAGSYNINNISAYASIELNLVVSNQEIAQQTNQTLRQIIEKDCIKVTWEYHRKTKNALRQFIRWFSYGFIRTVFYLFTFYFTQRRRVPLTA